LLLLLLWLLLLLLLLLLRHDIPERKNEGSANLPEHSCQRKSSCAKNAGPWRSRHAPRGSTHELNMRPRLKPILLGNVTSALAAARHRKPAP
jgi:hypothetical protein